MKISKVRRSTKYPDAFTIHFGEKDLAGKYDVSIEQAQSNNGAWEVRWNGKDNRFSNGWKVYRDLPEALRAIANILEDMEPLVSLEDDE